MKRKILYWGGYWLPSMIIGTFFSLARERLRPDRSPAKIAVFLIEHLGDAVVSAPLLSELRATFPKAEITAVVSSIIAPLLEKCPDVDRIIRVPKSKNWWIQLRNALKISRGLKSLDLDLSILPKDAIQDCFYELIPIAAPSRWKISLKPPISIYRIKPLKFALFHDEFVLTHGTKHEAEYRLSTIRRFTNTSSQPQLASWLDDGDISFANAFLAGIIKDNERPTLIAFAIGASLGKRRWPLKDFAAVIDQLAQKLSLVPILIVGPGDMALAEDLALLTSNPVYFERGASIRQNAALMARCALVIANDSGPMHIAAGLNVPVVEISCHPEGADTRSFNSPSRYGPLIKKRMILQPQPLDPMCALGGCQSHDVPHCITQIRPNLVVNAALSLLSSTTVVNSLPADNILS